MKKYFNLRTFLFFAFFISFCFTIYQRISFSTRFDSLGYNKPSFLFNEEFDPSLQRLNTVNSLLSYCDSLDEKRGGNRDSFPEIVSSVLKERFYHGYSLYGLKDNYLGTILGELTVRGLRAIVIPDDILKYPYAACSQQSIIGLEIFKRKGYNVRKVSMFDSVDNAGHFGYEVFYEKGWHYFDTNQEPDANVLMRYNRPSVAFLAKNPLVVLDAYRNKKEPDFFRRLFNNYTVGPVNKFPAPRAYIYQIVTKYLSAIGWLFILAAFLISYGVKYKKTRHLVNLNSTNQKSISKAVISHN